jgi:hypothetical protein
MATCVLFVDLYKEVAMGDLDEPLNLAEGW